MKLLSWIIGSEGIQVIYNVCTWVSRISVSKMSSELKDDKAISQYLPDFYEGQLPVQNFIHKIVCSLYPAEMHDLIEQAHKHRAVDANDRQQEMIEIGEGIVKK